MPNYGWRLTCRRRPAVEPSGRVAIALLCALLLGACGATTKVRSMFGGELEFTVAVAPTANENTAVAVDVVAVYDQKTLDALMKLSAREWFKDREQFVNDYGDSLAVNGWEWIPRQVVTPPTIKYRAGARKLVLFADYASEGAHRFAVDPQKKFHLTLDTLGFQVKVDE